MNIIIAFMYIFGFKISIIDSTILIGVILTGYMLCNKRYLNIFIKKISNKNFIYFSIAFALLFVWSLIAIEINQTQDFTYIKVLVHLIIVLCIGYEIISFYELKGKKNEIVNYIIISFIIQSIFQWIFFIFPSLSKVFNIFRSQSMIQNSIKYSGYRGIAITTSGFFSLSSAYAFTIVLFFTKYNTIIFKNKIIKYICFLILLSGTFFAGRTGFLGLVFALILILFRKRNKIRILKFKEVLAILMIILVIVNFFNLGKKNKRITQLYNFAFELVNNYNKGKGLTTTSTTKLLKMYKREISLKTFIIGDGKYTIVNSDGKTSYYMNTDVGYIRKILYFGSIGLVFSLIFQYYLFGKSKKTKEGLLFLLLLMVLELKGEIIGLNIMVNSIVILYSNVDFNRKDEK